MTFTSTTIMAMTSRIWISPPMVYEVTIPNSHITIRITQIVQSIISSPFNGWFSIEPVAAGSII
jgi:hypothetical protein